MATITELARKLPPRMSTESMPGEKILIFDIETAPATVSFETYDLRFNRKFIDHHSVTNPGRMIAWAAKWFGEEEVFYADLHDEFFLERLWELLDTASFVVGHNIDRFDLRKVNSFFAKENLPPYTKPKSIDTLKTLRQNFFIESSSLSYACRYFELEHRKRDEETGGAGALWRGVVDGDQEKRDLMKQYNCGDVLATEDLYVHLLPWAKTLPNMCFDAQGELTKCPRCGSDEIESAGTSQAIVIRYHQYRCLNCSGLFRGTFHSRASNVRTV